jgi:hypothetical protein
VGLFGRVIGCEQVAFLDVHDAVGQVEDAIVVRDHNDGGAALPT